jgi:hypothetical protein
MKPDDLAAILARKGYAVAPNSPASAPIVECNLRPRPLAKGEAQEPDPGIFLVRVTSFRRRLLDEDNLCEKYHVDCCRYAGLIPGDDPSKARIETRQEKVRSKAEERTEIVIERL